MRAGWFWKASVGPFLPRCTPRHLERTEFYTLLGFAEGCVPVGRVNLSVAASVDTNSGSAIILEQHHGVASALPRISVGLLCRRVG